MLVQTRKTVLRLYPIYQTRGRRRRVIRYGRTLLQGLVASLLLSVAPAYASHDSSAEPRVEHKGSVSQKSLISTGRRQTATTVGRGRSHQERVATTRRAGRRAVADNAANSELDAAYDPDAPHLMPNSGNADTRSNGDVISKGIASWYSADRYNKRTSSGEMFDENAMTAAHPWLPLGTRVRVTVEGSSESIIVTINDRQGSKSRVIDLSKGAARELGILGRGIARVTLTRS